MALRQRKGGIFGRIPRILLAVSLLLMTGALLSWWAVSRADERMRAELLRQAQQVAETMDPESVKALSGTAEDLKRPVYRRLKEQFSIVRGMTPKCRFVYLLGRRPDGAVYINLDSEPPDSKDYSPPGQPYDEVPKEFLKVFDTRGIAVMNPITDRWGTWVSVLVPLTDPNPTGSGTSDPEEARTMVRRAADYYRLHGRERLLQAIGARGGMFHRGELYAFAYDRSMTVVANPVKPELVGRNLLDRKDWPGGKFFRREIRDIARTRGSGWVDYQYENPVSGLLEQKKTYFEAVGDLVICAGTYRNSGAIRAVLGMDIDARDWHALLLKAALPSILLTLALTAILLSGSALLARRSGRSAASPARMQRIEPAIVILAGLSMTLYAAWTAHGNESRDRREAFATLASSKSAAIVHRLRGMTDADLAEMGFVNLLQTAAPDQSVFLDLALMDPRKGEVALAASHGADNGSDSGISVTRPLFFGNRVFAVHAQAGPEFLRLHPLRAGGMSALVGLLVTLVLALLMRQFSSRRQELDKLVAMRTGELRASESRLRVITDSAVDAIIMIDARGRTTFWNPAAEKLFGYSQHEALGRDLHGLIAPERYREQYLAAVGSFRETGQGAAICNTIKLHARYKNGAEFPVEVSLAALQMEEGWAAVGLIRDISERVRMDDELRRSELRFRSLFEQSPVAYQSLDEQGRYLDVNEVLCRLLGYGREELLGVRFDAMWSEQTRELFPARFEGFIRDGHTRGELELLRKDGTPFTAQLEGSVQRDAEGRFMRTHCILFDISERKRNALMLEQALLDAESANLAKSQFLANMSHEIRTPMNGVIGMTGLLLDTELDQEQRHYAGTIRSSAESLLGIINDILDFTKIEAGKLELEVLDFELGPVLENFADSLAAAVHQKGLEFICAADPDVPDRLRGDPGRLRQVLTNLAGNAVKFTHQGEIAVRATLQSQTDTHAVLRFSVKDTGIGISEEKQQQMFEKFTQADASITRRYGGTGLGLAIARELVELMGGEIGVISSEGHGAEFWFTVRLEKQAEREWSDAPVDLRGAHVLVVDDNRTNRDMLLTQLTAWGIRAEAAADGPGGLERLCDAQASNDPFQMAILDMHMPDMDGVELARTITGDTSLAETRLVLFSSMGPHWGAETLEQLGFKACLSKPARQSELYNCLSDVLAGTGAQRPEPVPPVVSAGRSVRPGGNRILLAEDNITNQLVALGILRKLGLSADVVANGLEAVEVLRKVPYDLVLMDVQMPEMNGLEATRRIRDPRTGVANWELPIIAMTAHAMQGDRERCLQAGMNDYITKPVTLEALAGALDRWLPLKIAPATTAGPAGEIPQQQAHPVLDRSGLAQRLMDDQELIRMVVETFLREMPGQLERLRSCLSDGDGEGVALLAHSIKGAAANVGGERLRYAALELEMTGRSGALAAGAAGMELMEKQFERLRLELQGLLAHQLCDKGSSSRDAAF